MAEQIEIIGNKIKIKLGDFVYEGSCTEHPAFFQVIKELKYCTDKQRVHINKQATTIEALSKEKNKYLKEKRTLRRFLRAIAHNLYGYEDCGLILPEYPAKGCCPCENCYICLAKMALKKNPPKFSKWRLI